ncbi:MAG TPA: transglutaminase domain-containing protein [Geothrix sp.]|nr:transglutaminase domain-containing protein [Geothrix sp.]
MRLRFLPMLLATVLMTAGEDPFEAPVELKDFAQKHTSIQHGTSGKVGALITAFFATPEDGGLGITYDNTYTRTPKEVWRDRKANCLGLTALYVAACKAIGLDARYGESLRVSRWRRVGQTIRYERHLVAVVPNGNIGQEIVADFLPEFHRGTLLIATLEPARVQALFHSNRAVELLEEGSTQEALRQAQQSIEVDPGLAVGWNILGVVQKAQGMVSVAESSFRKAIAADPADGAPCGNLENLLRAQGRESEATDLRERSMKIRLRDPYFNAFLAEESLGEGQLEESDRRIRQAIRLLPREPDFYVIQARVSLALGQKRDAIKALEKARKWSLPEMQAHYDSKLALLKGETPTP